MMSALHLSMMLGSVGMRGKEIGKGVTSETSWCPRTQRSSVCRDTSPSFGRTLVTRRPSWTSPYSAILTLLSTSNTLNVLLLPAALRGVGLTRMTCSGAKLAPGHAKSLRGCFVAKQMVETECRLGPLLRGGCLQGGSWGQVSHSGSG